MAYIKTGRKASFNVLKAKSKIIYLDHAGATPLDPRVEEVVLGRLKDFGNASSIHAIGRKAKETIEEARRKIAGILHARAEEIIFTGSGTESDNLAIFGIARAYKNLGRHIVTTEIEHHAVLRACQYLEKSEGFKVTYLAVGKNGIVDPEAVKKAIRSDTILVSIMYANNEIGTIQPIAKIGRLIRSHKQTALFSISVPPYFHTDACQAAGALNLNVQELAVDLMTLNGSKIYGPKGTGCLFLRRGARIKPLILGGSQERGRRAGTENPALLAGLAKALALAERNKEKETRRLIKLRDHIISRILTKIPNSKLNGDAKLRLPNNVNVSFRGIDGEMLMLILDQNGIEISTGAACTVTETGPSHVMKAINNPAGWGNLRLTLGRQTTKKDLDYVFGMLADIVAKLRK